MQRSQVDREELEKSLSEDDFHPIDIDEVVAPALINIEHWFPPMARGLHTRLAGDVIQTEDFQEEYLCINYKRFGVEPGFEAVKIDDEFLKAIKNNFSDLKQQGIFPEDWNEEPTLDSNEQMMAFSDKLRTALISDLPFRLNLIQFIRKKNERLDNPFTIWMFKQDYPDPDQTDRVRIPKERYREQINRPNDKPRSPSKRTEENLNAIRECIANDISTFYGIPTQQQELRVSSYSNGAVKFFTACKLESGFQELGKAYELRGDFHKTKMRKGLFENYLFDRQAKDGDKTAVIPDLGVLLALQLLMEERDFIGADGQNLGIVNGKPFMIDLGKAFQSTQFTGILNSLQDDGRFAEPLKWLPADSIRRHLLYRNSSILYDVPFAEIMMGIHILNKLVYGKIPTQEVINSYGEDFINIFNKVPGYGLELVFDQYILALQNLIKESDNSIKVQKELKSYIKAIEQTKKKALKNGEKILNTFARRIELTADQVELLSNLEKLTSITRDRTKNNLYQLSHLQVSSENRIPWQLEIDSGGKYYWLGYDLTKNRNLPDSAFDMKENFKKLNKFLFDMTEDGSNLLRVIKRDKVKVERGKYAIRINQEQLHQLINVVTEDNVRSYKYGNRLSKEKILDAIQSTLLSAHEQLQNPFPLFNTQELRNNFNTLSAIWNLNCKTESTRLLVALFILQQMDENSLVKKMGKNISKNTASVVNLEQLSTFIVGEINKKYPALIRDDIDKLVNLFINLDTLQAKQVFLEELDTNFYKFTEKKNPCLSDELQEDGSLSPETLRRSPTSTHD